MTDKQQPDTDWLAELRRAHGPISDAEIAAAGQMMQRAMREELEFKSMGESTGPYFTRDEVNDRSRFR